MQLCLSVGPRTWALKTCDCHLEQPSQVMSRRPADATFLGSGPAGKWKHCVSESLAVAARCDLLALNRSELTLAILTQFENLSQKGFVIVTQFESQKGLVLCNF